MTLYRSRGSRLEIREKGKSKWWLLRGVHAWHSVRNSSSPATIFHKNPQQICFYPDLEGSALRIEAVRIGRIPFQVRVRSPKNVESGKPTKELHEVFSDNCLFLVRRYEESLEAKKRGLGVLKARLTISEKRGRLFEFIFSLVGGTSIKLPFVSIKLPSNPFRPKFQAQRQDISLILKG